MCAVRVNVHVSLLIKLKNKFKNSRNTNRYNRMIVKRKQGSNEHRLQTDDYLGLRRGKV